MVLSVHERFYETIEDAESAEKSVSAFPPHPREHWRKRAYAEAPLLDGTLLAR